MKRAANVDIYQAHLMSSSKLKMKALGKLAEGTTATTFEACVLLHEAARSEQAALASLPTAPAETRLATAIELCWCLVEGRDPPGAATAWGEILRLCTVVGSKNAQPMLSRIEPLYMGVHDDFVKRLSKCKGLAAARASRVLVPASDSEARKTLVEVEDILKHYPGAPSLWWAKYRLLEHLHRVKEAWDALLRARQLEPQRASFLATSLLLSVRARSATEASEYVASIRSRLESAGAEVCLFYALAMIELAHKGAREERLAAARDAANAGLAQAGSTSMRNALLAAQLLLVALDHGEKPTLDIFYRADLGDVAASMPAGIVALSTVVNAVASLAAA